MESNFYVLLSDGVFLPCAHGPDFLHQLKYEISIKKQAMPARNEKGASVLSRQAEENLRTISKTL